MLQGISLQHASVLYRNERMCAMVCAMVVHQEHVISTRCTHGALSAVRFIARFSKSLNR